MKAPIKKSNDLMEYYLVHPDIADNILVRGNFFDISSFQRYNHQNQQWENSDWATHVIVMDTSTPHRKISEREAMQIIQAA